MITLGIDLASQPAATGACRVRWTPSGVEIEEPRVGLDDDALLEMMAAADAIGIDAPFGWPDAFVAAVGGWHRDGRWQADGDLRLRVTDRAVALITKSATGRASWPLSVSSDRIGIVSWRCAGLLDRFHERMGTPLDRVGASDVFEVYPAAALAMWRCPSRGYKPSAAADAAQGRQARRDIVAALATTAPWLAAALTAVDGDALISSGDGFDAFLSALVARAATAGKTFTPPDADRAQTQREGWIHVPLEKGLADLA